MALTKITNDGVDFSGDTDINIDSGTLVVDTSESRVGIGTTSPTQKLDVNGTVKATAFSGPASQVTVADESTDTTCFPLFVTDATGNVAPKSGSNLTFNSSTGALVATSFSGSGASLTALNGSQVTTGTIAAARVATLNQNTTGSSGSCTGNAATATKLATARTIGGVSFDGSANINLPGVNTAGNQNTTGSAALNVLKAGDTMTGDLKLNNSSLLVGPSAITPRTNLDGNEPCVQIEGTTDSTRRMSIISSTSGNTNAQLILAAQRSGTVGGNTIVGDNHNLGAIIFMGNDGTNFKPGAIISGETDANPANHSNRMASRIVFSTQPNDGDIGPEARFRIAHDGGMRFWQDVGNPQRYWFKTEETSNSSIKFIRGSYGASDLAAAGTEMFLVMGNGDVKTTTGTNIQPISSERRVKQNIEGFDSDYAWETVKSIIPRKFEMKATPGHQCYGYIVDELPEEFHRPGTEEDEEGPIRTYNTQHVEFMYRVALKKALERIETLEANYTALETRLAALEAS